MPDHPDPGDPVSYVPWACESVRELGRILVIVLDEPPRGLLLRRIAQQLYAPYITCKPTRSPRQFLAFLAGEIGAPVRRTSHELWGEVRVRLRREPWLVFLDDAEHLNRTALRIVLSFHKEGESAQRHVAFVLASGKRRLLEHIDAVDAWGSFTSHCIIYAPYCKPTKRMRE
jgi:hypothetical protein